MRTDYIVLIFIVVSFIALLIETTIISFPFVLLISLMLVIMFRNVPSYVSALILGVAIDSMRVAEFGITPLFIFGVAAFLYLYEKYFGSKDIAIVAFVVIVAGFLYSYLSHYSMEFVTIVFAIVIAGWYLIVALKKKQTRNYYE